MCIERRVYLLVLILLLSPKLYCQSKFASVDKQLRELNERREFNGNVLVAKDGKVIYSKSIGYANMELAVPLQADSKFEIASLAKPFTALLILQLVEKGKIKLEGKIADYIPQFIRKDAQHITVHHLLSHTSGLQDFVGINCPFAAWTEKEFLEGLAKTPVNFKAGSQFQYASSTYVLLKYIIERVTNQSYEDNLQEHVLKVAAMTNSGVIHNQVLIKDRAIGYLVTEKGYMNALTIANNDIFIGAASIYSTVGDLLKWDQALYGEKLLSNKYKDLMFKAIQPPYGYGWFISEDSKNGKVVSHGGDTFGYTSLIDRNLKSKTLTVILSNVQSIDREVIVKILRDSLPQ
jgi:CubicO group peptidase (beta-lactamase class C family)